LNGALLAVGGQLFEFECVVSDLLMVRVARRVLFVIISILLTLFWGSAVGGELHARVCVRICICVRVRFRVHAHMARAVNKCGCTLVAGRCFQTSQLYSFFFFFFVVSAPASCKPPAGCLP
jgi:hypothetical protein